MSFTIHAAQRLVLAEKSLKDLSDITVYRISLDKKDPRQSAAKREHERRKKIAKRNDVTKHADKYENPNKFSVDKNDELPPAVKKRMGYGGRAALGLGLGLATAPVLGPAAVGVGLAPAAHKLIKENISDRVKYDVFEYNPYNDTQRKVGTYPARQAKSLLDKLKKRAKNNAKYKGRQYFMQQK